MFFSAARGAIPPSWAQIHFVDTPVSNTTIDRSVAVYPRGPQGTAGAYGWSASGRVPDARDFPTDVPFAANWWGVADSVASVLSANVGGQTVAFTNLTDSAQAVTIKPTCNSPVLDLIGADEATADAFVLAGFLPKTNGTDMVATPAGPVKGGCI